MERGQGTPPPPGSQRGAALKPLPPAVPCVSLGSTSHSAWLGVRLTKVSSCCDCNLQSPWRALCGAQVDGAAEGENRCSSVSLSGRGSGEGPGGRPRTCRSGLWALWQLRSQRKQGPKKRCYCSSSVQRFLLGQLLPHSSPLKVGGLSLLSAMGPWALLLEEHGSFIQDFLLDLGLRACHGLGPDWSNDPDDSTGRWGPGPLAVGLACLQCARVHFLSHLLSPGTVFVSLQVSNSVVSEWEGFGSVHRRLGHPRKLL